MTLWIVIVGFVIGFALAFSIGANDVANSFGTSVGSGVLTLRKACILASIFEMAGAVLLGQKVSGTISKGIIDADLYANEPTLLELGYLSSLIGACLWLLAATFLKLPVSGTHSIVGAVIGFTIVAKGPIGVQWQVLIKIVASWFISPVFSGIISAALYFLVQYTILREPTHLAQLDKGILLLPVIYFATFAINSFSIFNDGPRLLYFHLIPVWGAILASVGVGIISAIIARWYIGPRLHHHIISRRATLRDLSKLGRSISETPSVRRGNTNLTGSRASVATEYARTVSECQTGNNDEDNKAIVQKLLEESNSVTHSVASLYLVAPFPMGTIEEQHAAPVLPPPPATTTTNTSPSNPPKDAPQAKAANDEIEYPGTFELFAFLQVLIACFGAFAHGGNDVSNAIGPVIGLFGLHQSGSPSVQSQPELWIMAFGGAGISVGLWVLGRRVIETVGTDLSEVTPVSGFCIELGAATTVLIASQAYVPVSTTHCKIGSVVFVGIARGGRRQIDWRIFRNIVLAWLITVPVSGLVSAGIMALFKLFYTPPEFIAGLSNATNITGNATDFLFSSTNVTNFLPSLNLTRLSSGGSFI